MKQAAIQLPENEGTGAMASKFLNFAIGIVILALLATGGFLVYRSYFQTTDIHKNTLEATLEKWQIAAEADPGDSLIRANLGAAYLDMGMADEAIKELRLALDQEPDSYPYMLKLGAAYRLAGDYDAAIGMFLESADRHPKTEKYPSLFEAANTSMMKGDVAAAKDYVQQSIDDNDMIWNTHFLLGQIIEQEGDIEGAKAQYDIANKYNPNLPELQEALARVSIQSQ